MLPWERARFNGAGLRRPPLLDGQSFAPAEASPPQDVPPTRRMHPLEEAVNALPRDALGLIGPLWHRSPSDRWRLAADGAQVVMSFGFGHYREPGKRLSKRGRREAASGGWSWCRRHRAPPPIALEGAWVRPRCCLPASRQRCCPRYLCNRRPSRPRGSPSSAPRSCPLPSLCA